MSQNSIHPWDCFWVNLGEGTLKILGRESEKLYRQASRLDFYQNGEKGYKYSVCLSELKKIKEAKPNRFVKLNQSTEARKLSGGLQIRKIIEGSKKELTTFTEEEFRMIEEYL